MIGDAGMLLNIEDVSVRFQSRAALQNVDLTFTSKQFISIVGPSGCGKSSLLNLIAGLAAPTEGRVTFDGKESSGINKFVGYVPQDDKLFPWLTVFNNVAFPLQARGVARADQEETIRQALDLVGLGEHGHVYPHQLSGGMKKRAALARTLVYKPQVLLLDEPFGPLDAQTRMILQDELLSIWSQAQPLAVFVTHDLNEAIALSDIVVVMSKSPGRVKKVIKVNLPRPRSVFEIQQHPDFAAVYGEVWDAIKDEIIVKGRAAHTR
jgi:NitT/TauT family transport system ATP-binding protein